MLIKLGSVGQITEVKDKEFLAKSNFLQHLNAKLKNCYVTGTFEKVTLNLAKAIGVINCNIETQCYRCAKDISFNLRLNFNETFSQENDDENYKFAGSLLDITQMIVDLILLNYPHSVLCKPNCLGRCEKCGNDKNTDKCICDKELELIDPANPFNALKKLKLK